MSITSELEYQIYRIVEDIELLDAVFEEVGAPDQPDEVLLRHILKRALNRWREHIKPHLGQEVCNIGGSEYQSPQDLLRHIEYTLRTRASGVQHKYQKIMLDVANLIVSSLAEPRAAEVHLDRETNQWSAGRGRTDPV